MAGVSSRCSACLKSRRYFSYHAVGQLVVVIGTMQSTDYVDILHHNLLDSVGGG